jgi:hypothetical protein
MPSDVPDGGELDNINEDDKHEVDRVVPHEGETAEHDMATQPDEVSSNPDDAGNRPRPV